MIHYNLLQLKNNFTWRLINNFLFIHLFWHWRSWPGSHKSNMSYKSFDTGRWFSQQRCYYQYFLLVCRQLSTQNGYASILNLRKKKAAFRLPPFDCYI